MSTELKSLLHFVLPSSSGSREVELRIPSMLRVSGLLHEEGVRNAQLLRIWLPTLIMVFVARLDGMPLEYDRVEPVVQDTEFMRGLLVRIRALLDTLRERGKVFVLCPGCRKWEAEVPVTAYALAVASPIPSSFDGPFLTFPSTASLTLLPGSRPPIPPAAQVRFELPSSTIGLTAPIQSGILGELGSQPEEKQPPPPLQFEDDGEGEDESSHNYEPNRTGPGWRALLRLSRAIQPPLALEVIEELPAIDFFFLELVYFLTALAPIAPNTSGRIVCPNCSTVFLPVLSTSLEGA